MKVIPLQILVLLSCCLDVMLAQDKQLDKIDTLPGLNFPITFNQYSGFISLDEMETRNIFYWFVESRSDPVNDPIIFWTNGVSAPFFIPTPPYLYISEAF